MVNPKEPQPKYVVYNDNEEESTDHDLISVDIVPQEVLAKEHMADAAWILRKLWKENIKIFKSNNRAYGCKVKDINWRMRLQSWQYLMALARILRTRHLYEETTKIWNLQDGRDIHVET